MYFNSININIVFTIITGVLIIITIMKLEKGYLKIWQMNVSRIKQCDSSKRKTKEKGMKMRGGEAIKPEEFL